MVKQYQQHRNRARKKRVDLETAYEHEPFLVDRDSRIIAQKTIFSIPRPRGYTQVRVDTQVNPYGVCRPGIGRGKPTCLPWGPGLTHRPGLTRRSTPTECAGLLIAERGLPPMIGRGLPVAVGRMGTPDYLCIQPLSLRVSVLCERSNLHPCKQIASTGKAPSRNDSQRRGRG